MYDQDTPFNMAIATLERIDELLKDCANYCVNNHVIAYKRNLKEVLKEAWGHLTKEERKVSINKWTSINEIKIVVLEDGLEYDSKLKDLLEDFDFWIRWKLHDHNLTFSRKEANKGLEAQYNKYGVKK